MRRVMPMQWRLPCGLALAVMVACGGIVKGTASDAGTADDGSALLGSSASSSGSTTVGGNSSGSAGGSTSGSSSGGSSAGGSSGSSSGVGSSSSGSSSGSTSGSSTGGSSGSSSGTTGDAASDGPLPDAPIGACSGAPGGACNLGESNVATCKALDNGTATGQSECIACFQGDCPGGTQNLFTYLQNCLCYGGPCTSACAGANDYCQVAGCGANTGCSSGCSNCVNQYTAAGQTCDFNSGPVAACCTADPLCKAYLADLNTDCP